MISCLRDQGVFEPLRAHLPVDNYAEGVLTERLLLALFAGLAGGLLMPEPLWAAADVTL